MEPLGPRIAMVLQALQSYNLRQRNSTQWQARCPVHGGSDKDSLTVTWGTSGKVLMHCHSQGCDYHQILGALGITLEGDGENYYDEGTRYVYLDPQGRPVHAQVRQGRKQFHAERWGGQGWEKGAPEDRTLMVPYHLPDVIKAVEENEYVWIVEGEKDADIMKLHGFASTTVANGSSGWRPHYAKWFQGANVVMIPDRDKAGQKFRNEVEVALRGFAGSFQVIDLPYELTETGGADIADWFRAGHSAKELKTMVNEAWRLDGVITLDEAADIDNWYEEAVFQSFGMVGLGDGYQIPGIGPGLFLIIAARLGVGKTAWVIDLVGRVITQSSLRVMISTYDEPASRMRQYLAASVMKDHRYTDWHMPMHHRIHHRNCQVLEDQPVLLDTRRRPIGEVEHIARNWRPDVLVVDHLAMIKGAPRADMRETLEETANRLRTLSTDLRCCVIGLSQLNRPGDDLHYLATAANLYGSDAIGHTADAILCLQRPVSKSRGKVDAALQLEECEEKSRIDSTWEQYRVIHTMKNRLGPEMGCWPVRQAGAIRKLFPLHEMRCDCDRCQDHKSVVANRSKIEQEVMNG